MHQENNENKAFRQPSMKSGLPCSLTISVCVCLHPQHNYLHTKLAIGHGSLSPTHCSSLTGKVYGV